MKKRSRLTLTLTHTRSFVSSNYHSVKEISSLLVLWRCCETNPNGKNIRVTQLESYVRTCYSRQWRRTYSFGRYYNPYQLRATVKMFHGIIKTLESFLVGISCRRPVVCTVLPSLVEYGKLWRSFIPKTCTKQRVYDGIGFCGE